MAPSIHMAPAEIGLTDPNGNSATLGEYRANPLTIILVRYFGCLPCQDYLRELDRARQQFPSESGLIAIGGSAAYQARWLRKTKGIAIPLLLDPEHRVRAVADVGSLTPLQMAKPGGLGNYAKAMLRGLPPQVPTGDVMKAPGIVVFDSEFSPLWVHHGKTLGDYPPVADLVEQVNELALRSG